MKALAVEAVYDSMHAAVDAIDAAAAADEESVLRLPYSASSLLAPEARSRTDGHPDVRQ